MDRAVYFRYLTLLFAALHLVVPPLASVADARLERQSAEASRLVAHVEPEGGSPTCPYVHAVDCALCHVLATLAKPGERAPAALPIATAAAATTQADPGARTTGRLTTARPRAPPAS